MLRPLPSRSALRHRERPARPGGLARRVATALVAAAAGSLVGATASHASWTATVTGGGEGSLAGATLRVAAAAPAVAVSPSGAAQPVPVTLTNDGPTPYQVTSLIPHVASRTDGCPADALAPRLVDPVPAVPADGAVTVDVLVSMPPDAPDSCQGATVRLSVSVAGRHQ